MFTNEEQAKKEVELSEALERLEQNADYKRVISEGYLDNLTKGLVMTLAYSTEAQLKERLNKLIGISNLKMYLVTIKASGERAKEALADPSVFESGENE
jgi:hypothetical protein